MIQSNQEVYNNMTAFLSIEEGAPILPKIKYYLDHYVKDYSVTNFKVEITVCSSVDRVVLYTSEDKSTYRQLKFNGDGDLLSVMHFVWRDTGIAQCVYALPKKSIERINKE